MLRTHILTDQEPLDAILSGAEKLYKAVSTTMGPKGHNVIFRQYGKRVGVTHDGVTVAKTVRLDNPLEDVAAELLREAAVKLDSTTGDGTTTVTVLAYHILKGAAERIKAGENPMTIKRELEKLEPYVIKRIKDWTDDAGIDEVVAVASVASGDKEIGKEVGRIIFEAGINTPVLLAYSDSTETYSEVIDGFKIDSGPASPYLMEGAGLRLEMENPKIIVADAKLRDKEDVLPLLQIIAQLPQEERNILLVVSDIASDALSIMVLNRLKGFANIAIARVPEAISSHPDYLKDVSISCGATLLSRNTGNTIKDPLMEHFGSAERVIVEPRETIIVKGHRIPEDFDIHTDSLKKLAESGKDAATRKFADDRIKTLSQKVVSIRVGGQTEAEASEKHYRYEDALGASKAALRGGVVPGGGTLLYYLAKDVDSDILAEALRSPLRKVLENAGVSSEGIKITPGSGVDVMNPDEGVVDLVGRGILDPAESEIECVRTAISIAGLLMTSGAMIVDFKEESNDSMGSLS